MAAQEGVRATPRPTLPRSVSPSALVPQRVRVPLVLVPEARRLLRRSAQPCRSVRHPPVLPLTRSRQGAGPPYVRTAAACAFSPCRAAPRRAAPARSRRAGASRARQIDPFECRDDLDMDGNAFDPSAVEEGEDSGIPNLGFLRVVRHAATKP